jgi:hypothetical protein
MELSFMGVVSLALRMNAKSITVVAGLAIEEDGNAINLITIQAPSGEWKDDLHQLPYY